MSSANEPTMSLNLTRGDVAALEQLLSIQRELVRLDGPEVSAGERVLRLASILSRASDPVLLRKLESVSREWRGLFLVRAPWSPQQVEALRRWQADDMVHPYTYDDPKRGRVKLTPTSEGWVAHVGGPVVQRWAHDFSTTWEPTAPLPATERKDDASG